MVGNGMLRVQVHEIFGLPDEDHVHLAVACIKKSQALPCITCTLLPRLKMGFQLVHAMQSNGPHYKCLMQYHGRVVFVEQAFP